jgi:single-strand DNA-binding protein
VIAWDRLAETCGRFLGKGQQVAVEGRIQTRSWDDDAGKRHWRTEIVASSIEMLSGRRKKDYAAETAAGALEARAAQLGDAPLDAQPGEPVPADEPIPDDAAFAVADTLDDGEEEEDLEEVAAA